MRNIFEDAGDDHIVRDPQRLAGIIALFRIKDQPLTQRVFGAEIFGRYRG